MKFLIIFVTSVVALTTGAHEVGYSHTHTDLGNLSQGYDDSKACTEQSSTERTYNCLENELTEQQRTDEEAQRVIYEEQVKCIEDEKRKAAIEAIQQSVRSERVNVEITAEGDYIYSYVGDNKFCRITQNNINFVDWREILAAESRHIDLTVPHNTFKSNMLIKGIDDITAAFYANCLSKNESGGVIEESEPYFNKIQATFDSNDCI